MRIVLLFLIALLPVVADAHAYRVFMLHSYSQEYPWTKHQHSGFIGELSSALGHETLFSVEYLDTKRRDFSTDYQELFATYLKRKYEHYRPDVIYVTDDHALRFAIRYLASMFPDTPVVFSGVNDYAVLDGIDTDRFTGVFEKKAVTPNIDLLRNATPGPLRVAFVGDGSSTYQTIERQIRLELETLRDVEPVFVASEKVDAVVAALQSARIEHVLLTTLGKMKDAEGNAMDLAAIVGAIAGAGNFAVLTMEDVYMQDGILGGYMTDGARQGRTAANLAVKALAGTPVAAIAPVLESPNSYLFDHRELLKRGIAIPAAIREQARIANQPASFYQANRPLIVGLLTALTAVLFLTLAIGSLLLTRKNVQIRRQYAALNNNQALLNRVKESLQEAQTVAAMGNWDWDIRANTLFWSEGIYAVFGLPTNAFEPSYEAFLERVHPADRAAVVQAVRGALDETSQYAISHRIVCPDGTIRHVHERARVERDAGGRPLRMIGTVQDISEKKEAEDTLRASEESYRGLFNSVHEAIYILDENGTFIDVNRGAVEMYGVPREDLIGKAPSDVSAPGKNDLEQVAQQFAEALAGSPQHLEFWGKRGNGEAFPKEVHLYKGQYFGKDVIIAVASDITERKRAEARLRELATKDSLTHLPNRNTLVDRLGQAIRRARRNDSHLAILFLDLDRFKQINDSLGHTVGDRLLQEVAGRLRALLREEDTVARLGGDEFVVLLDRLERPEDAGIVAAKIIERIGLGYRIYDYNLFITTSIGISIYPTDGDDEERMLKNADAAMYHAKASGRNGYSFYTEEITRSVAERVELENKLREALNQDAFRLSFQPIYRLDGQTVVGAETLLRWHDPELGDVSPARFIPIAEDSGFILQLGGWVLRKACETLRTWLDAGLVQTGMKLNINISGTQLIQRDFAQGVKRIIDETAVPPSMLVIELTEGVLLENRDEAAAALRELVRLGMHVAIDDFGTGYSSLSYLKALPIDTIKIDRNFVHGIGHNDNDRAITRAVIALAHSLGLQVVAEGIETRDQEIFLLRHGCALGQGYLFQRPVAQEAFEALLAKRACVPG